MQSRNTNGTFKRIRKHFSLKNFNDGYIDNKGRFRVWLPEHPRAYENGYVLRAILAYELYNNIIVPANMDIHHKDGKRLNDSKENLIMLSHSQHSHLSNPKRETMTMKICENCGKEFLIKKWRLKLTDSNRGRFCSQKCYHQCERTKEHRKNISGGLKRAYREGRR